MQSPVGAAIIVHGTDEQRAHFLQRIADGTDVYCQGFAEPDHGSDLAGVETRGEVDADELVITGHKVWTSGADQANAIYVLCRTDANAPRYHNLSYVLLPLHENNIELRPLRVMSGASGYFEVLFDGARAPLSNVIGGLGNGWRVAMTTLEFERVGQSMARVLEYEREFWELVETARCYGRHQDPLVRQQLAWAYAQIQILRYSDLIQASQPRTWIDTFANEYHRRFGEIAVDILGADALVRPAQPEGYVPSGWQEVFLSSRADTITTGTREIQRTIIAERMLGLPAEP